MHRSVITVAAICINALISVSAFSMTGLEFIKLTGDALAQREAIQLYIQDYVAQGYREVPDWASLLNKMDALIRKNGWGSKDLKDIAFEAAKGLGMTK